jgi:hypothetical protein
MEVKQQSEVGAEVLEVVSGRKEVGAHFSEVQDERDEGAEASSSIEP